MKELKKRVLLAIGLGVGFALLVLLPVLAGSTTKSLSTNFTLVNLSPDEANGVVQYLKPDGSEWRSTEAFTVAGSGGQAIFAQYLPGSPGYISESGQGSVIVSANQELGAVVQIQARNQTATSGAYTGFSSGSSSFYVPLVVRRLNTASGMANSQISVQNTGSSPANVDVRFVDWSTGNSIYTKTISSLSAGASYLYDLDDETNLSAGFVGSAVVEAEGAGEIAVVSNFFTGSHAMQTFNGFSGASPSTAFVVPLFVSRLSNGLSAPVTIQNVSGSPISAGSIVMTCTVDSTSPNPTPTTFSVSNPASVADSNAFAINPVVDMTLPANWLGSCRITSPQDVIAFVQMRFVTGDRAAAYEAMDANSTDTTVVVPLVAKRLGNTFATAVTIQNLDVGSTAAVTLTYKASAGYSPDLTVNTTIPAGGSLIQNHRVDSSHPQGVALPDVWLGTLTVESDLPIVGFVQLDFTGYGGDPYMAHGTFTLP